MNNRENTASGTEKWKKALRPYRARLCWEAALRAIFFAAPITLTAGIAFTAVLGFQPGLLPAAAVYGGLGAFFLLCAFVRYWFFFRPSWKETGLRLDELGLGGRMATLVEFGGDPRPVCEMQREDALKRLENISPKALPLRWPRKGAAVSLLLAAALAGTALLPFSSWMQAPASPPAPDTEEMRLIREMLQSVSAQIDDSALSDEEKAALRERLKQLMEQIEESGEMGLAALASAAGEVDALTADLADLERVESILGELMKTVALGELANALAAQEEALVRTAMGNLRNQMLSVYGPDRQKRVQDTAEEIDRALSRVPGAEQASLSSDYLAYCFGRFSSNLHITAQAISAGLNGADEVEENIREMTERLVAALENGGDSQTRKMALSELLAQQEAERKEAGAMDGESAGAGGAEAHFSSQLYTVGREGVSGGLEEERERYLTGETVYEPTLDPALDGSYVPGKKGRDGMPQRQVVTADTPLAGHVPFEQVYGVYYAKLLDQLETMDGDMLEKVERYYYGMLVWEKNQNQEE